MCPNLPPDDGCRVHTERLAPYRYFLQRGTEKKLGQPFPFRYASGTVGTVARYIDRKGEFVWREVRGGLNRANGGAWVETPIPDAPGWYVACLLLRVGDSVTLAELRIIPSAGRWLLPKHPATPPTVDPSAKGPWTTAVLIAR